MKLNDIKVCIQCEEIHTVQQCPACGLGPSYFVSNWVNGHTALARMIEERRRAELVPTPGQLEDMVCEEG